MYYLVTASFRVECGLKKEIRPPWSDDEAGGVGVNLRLIQPKKERPTSCFRSVLGVYQYNTRRMPPDEYLSQRRVRIPIHTNFSHTKTKGSTNTIDWKYPLKVPAEGESAKDRYQTAPVKRRKRQRQGQSSTAQNRRKKDFEMKECEIHAWISRWTRNGKRRSALECSEEYVPAQRSGDETRQKNDQYPFKDHRPKSR